MEFRIVVLFNSVKKFLKLDRRYTFSENLEKIAIRFEIPFIGSENDIISS